MAIVFSQSPPPLAPHAPSWIEKTPGVCGGDACIRNTRITVRSLVEYQLAGLADRQLLDAYPGLNQADLMLAWTYYDRNKQEIDDAIARERLA